jgi:hypothetical protein
MTPEQLKLKNEIEEARVNWEQAARTFHKLQYSCKCHVPVTKGYYVYCQICGDKLGWACEESPDGVCHFDSEEGRVKLVDGTDVPMPEDGYDNQQNQCCLFCGDFDERK